LHALQHGFPSSHFFLRSLQVKHPVRDRLWVFDCGDFSCWLLGLTIVAMVLIIESV
jgi:hypothetical protein